VLHSQVINKLIQIHHYVTPLVYSEGYRELALSISKGDICDKYPPTR